MGLYTDALALIDCPGYFASQRHEFGITLGAALALAGGCWVAANYYVRLWNLRFRPTLIHHVLCFAAALCTLVFTLSFASLKFTKRVRLF